MLPPSTGICTSPASSPSLLVVTVVCAATGSTAVAKPAASEVTTNSRRVSPFAFDVVAFCIDHPPRDLVFHVFPHRGVSVDAGNGVWHLTMHHGLEGGHGSKDQQFSLNTSESVASV